MPVGGVSETAAEGGVTREERKARRRCRKFFNAFASKGVGFSEDPKLFENDCWKGFLPGAEVYKSLQSLGGIAGLLSAMPESLTLPKSTISGGHGWVVDKGP